MLKDEKFAS